MKTQPTLANVGWISNPSAALAAIENWELGTGNWELGTGGTDGDSMTSDSAAINAGRGMLLGLAGAILISKTRFEIGRTGRSESLSIGEILSVPLESEKEVNDWVQPRNDSLDTIGGQFKTEGARIKLQQLYPSSQS